MNVKYCIPSKYGTPHIQHFSELKQHNLINEASMCCKITVLVSPGYLILQNNKGFVKDWFQF